VAIWFDGPIFKVGFGEENQSFSIDLVRTVKFKKNICHLWRVFTAVSPICILSKDHGEIGCSGWEVYQAGHSTQRIKEFFKEKRLSNYLGGRSMWYWVIWFLLVKNLSVDLLMSIKVLRAHYRDTGSERHTTTKIFSPAVCFLQHYVTLIKVARSDFWVTILFNFERLEYHHDQSDRESNVTGMLEKDESFKWGTFYQDLSYHSNVMTSYPIWHATE